MEPKDTHHGLVSKGLGDTVAKVIHAVTGIEPCEACRRRRDRLNEMFPYRAKPKPETTGKSDFKPKEF